MSKTPNNTTPYNINHIHFRTVMLRGEWVKIASMCGESVGFFGAKELNMDNKETAVEIRHRAFVQEMIRNGFNATKAYQKVYGVSDESSAASASRLLSNVNIEELITEEMRTSGMACFVSKEAIIHEGAKLLREGSENTKIRILELFAKIGGLLNTGVQVNTAIFKEDVLKGLEQGRARVKRMEEEERRKNEGSHIC